MNPNPSSSPKVSQLATKLGLQFKDRDIFFQALTHRSFLNENRQLHLESNERLEFLGDAVLETCISAYLYNHFPSYPEGQLTNLRALIVCTDNLAAIATSINLGEFIFLSKGEETHGGRSNNSILADTVEAIIGASFVDQGWTKTNRFVINLFREKITQFSSQKIFKDPKSIFQELAQFKKGITPRYEGVSETGPDHHKTFKVAVYVGDDLIATGVGNSKQKAEEAASLEATKTFNNLV